MLSVAHADAHETVAEDRCDYGHGAYRCVLHSRHEGLHSYAAEAVVTDEDQLADWWRRTAEAEIDATVAKAVEYGADDLIEIGRELVLAGVRMPEGPATDEEKFAELGIFFYEVGKFARWRSAVRRGARPSDDTFKDIGVYIRMSQRVRSNGQWP